MFRFHLTYKKNRKHINKKNELKKEINEINKISEK